MSAEAERLMSGEAWRDWCDRLKAAGERLLGDEFPSTPRDRAEGYRALTRLLIYATQQEVESGDPLFPSFVRHQDPHNQWGGPNPDNVYLRAPIDPAHSYRVWTDDVRGCRQALFSLHEGDMQLEEYGVYSETSLDQLAVGEDGKLELYISGHAPEGGGHVRNWMPSHDLARIFTIRIYQSDWSADTAPTFHIERVGAEGVPRPPLEPERLGRGLERAVHWVEKSSVFWNQYTRAAWQRATPNVAGPARSTPGGADNILYGNVLWDLGPEEALLLEVAAPDAQYWNFVVQTRHWLESCDWAERQTSLNHCQAHIDDDGIVRVVVAHDDPGAPNWIDTEGRKSAMLVYRWVWANDNPEPVARVLKLSELRAALPPAHPSVSEGERRRRLSARREAAWNRFQSG